MQINRKCSKCGLACVNLLLISSLYTNGFWPNSMWPYFSVLSIGLSVLH